MTNTNKNHENIEINKAESILLCNLQIDLPLQKQLFENYKSKFGQKIGIIHFQHYIERFKFITQQKIKYKNEQLQQIILDFIDKEIQKNGCLQNANQLNMQNMRFIIERNMKGISEQIPNLARLENIINKIYCDATVQIYDNYCDEKQKCIYYPYQCFHLYEQFFKLMKLLISIHNILLRKFDEPATVVKIYSIVEDHNNVIVV